MSRYTGPGGSRADTRNRKRTEAVARNAVTPVERRRWYRLGLPGPEAVATRQRTRRARKAKAGTDG